MKSIEFYATYGDKIKKVKIIWSLGRDHICQILIDNQYQRQMIYQDGKWRTGLISKTILNIDDGLG